VRINASDVDAARRAELGTLLRTRRALLQPEDVGIDRNNRRRNTPGLRREEVANISGVGLTWYTWLEQGRPITVSEHVVDALARALRFDAVLHRHVRRLAGLPVFDSELLPEYVLPKLQHLLDSLVPAPACLFGPALDYVAWNEAHARLWNVGEQTSEHRNLVWLALMSSQVRRMVLDRELLIPSVLARFRYAVGEHPGDPRLTELVAALQAESEEFRALWGDFEVGESITGLLRVDHPTVGVINFDVTELRVSAHPSLLLSIQVPIELDDRRKILNLMVNSDNTDRWPSSVAIPRPRC
jgi:hypothetical protein